MQVGRQSLLDARCVCGKRMRNKYLRGFYPDSHVIRDELLQAKEAITPSGSRTGIPAADSSNQTRAELSYVNTS